MNETGEGRTTACDRFELELPAYMEGEGAPFVPAHARGCAFCRVILEDLEALQAAALTLPLEEPSPLVWSYVRAQLQAVGAFTEKAGFWDWFRQLGLLQRPIPVAAFAGMVVVGCLLTAPRNYPEPDTTSPISALPARSAVRSMAFMGEGVALEQVVRELETTFRAREGSLAPDLKATYENSLVSLDASIRECSDSLQREPDNSLAHEYLLSAYSQKAEVLSSALEFDEGR
jgi:hypothetical protein